MTAADLRRTAPPATILASATQIRPRTEISSVHGPIAPWLQKTMHSPVRVTRRSRIFYNCMIIIYFMENPMPSPAILTRLALLTAAILAVQSAPRTVRACENPPSAVQAPLAQTDSADEPRSGSDKRSAQVQDDIPSEIVLATGDR